MRVLLLATDIYGGHGGIALYNRDVAAALASMASVAEITVLPRIIPRGDQHQEIPPKVRFASGAAAGRFAYLGNLLRLKRERFDLVFCAHVNLLPAAMLFARDPVLFVYGIEAWRPCRRIADRLLRRCRGVVSISRITRDRLVAWSGFDGPAFLLPNAIHQSSFGIRQRNEELASRYGLEGKRVLLTVGRLVSSERYKGFDEVLRVLPRLPRDVAYLIAGDGDDRRRLETLAASLGVRDRVVFTGFFPESEKADLYSLADAYVMPSRGEGFGFVFLEAMAAGVPVIGSRHDGGREALRDGELGLLVDPSNPADLEAAIHDVLAAPARRIPPGLEYFSFERFTERLEEIVAAVR